MPRRRFAPPSDIEPLFHFCRHCDGNYTPQEGSIEGVYPECAQRLYTRRDRAGGGSMTPGAIPGLRRLPARGGVLRPRAVVQGYRGG